MNQNYTFIIYIATAIIALLAIYFLSKRYHIRVYVYVGIFGCAMYMAHSIIGLLSENEDKVKSYSGLVYALMFLYYFTFRLGWFEKHRLIFIIILSVLAGVNIGASVMQQSMGNVISSLLLCLILGGMVYQQEYMIKKKESLPQS